MRIEKLVLQNDNNRILTFVYLYTAKINLYFLEGTFTDGLKLVPYMEKMLRNINYILIVTGCWYFIIKSPVYILAAAIMKKLLFI